MAGFTTASMITMGMTAASLGLAAYGTFAGAAGARGAGAAGRMAAEAAAQKAEFDAAQQKDLIEETKTQAAQQAAQRTEAYMRMFAGNAAGAATQGIGDSASADAIATANKTGTNTDLANINYMGLARINAANNAIKQDEYAAQANRAAGEVVAEAGDMKAMGSLAMGGWNMLQNMPSSKRMGQFWDWATASSSGPQTGSGSLPQTGNYVNG